MEFKIKTSELKLLDEKVFNLNKKYGMALSSLHTFPNIHATQQVIVEIESLKLELKKLKTKDEFEELLIHNHLQNIEAQRVYLEYFTTRKKENIDQVFTKILGEEGLDIIKKNIKEFDYKSFWDYYLSYQEYTYKQIPSDDESLREELKKILVNLKKDLLGVCRKTF